MFRRCYVNQNEKYDYIGRAATLQIRDLGVYAVYGSEDRGRVEWKFEYLVQESISESTGEVRTNEKVCLNHSDHIADDRKSSPWGFTLHPVTLAQTER